MHSTIEEHVVKFILFLCKNIMNLGPNPMILS